MHDLNHIRLLSRSGVLLALASALLLGARLAHSGPMPFPDRLEFSVAILQVDELFASNQIITIPGMVPMPGEIGTLSIALDFSKLEVSQPPFSNTARFSLPSPFRTPFRAELTTPSGRLLPFGTNTSDSITFNVDLVDGFGGTDIDQIFFTGFDFDAGFTLLALDPLGTALDRRNFSDPAQVLSSLPTNRLVGAFEVLDQPADRLRGSLVPAPVSTQPIPEPEAAVLFVLGALVVAGRAAIRSGLIRR